MMKCTWMKVGRQGMYRGDECEAKSFTKAGRGTQRMTSDECTLVQAVPEAGVGAVVVAVAVAEAGDLGIEVEDEQIHLYCRRTPFQYIC